ncbi:hypothetical protein TNIN_299111 [Trichonephila inaurata madagascariensis]|uniref:Uncharacterized protein n=1 Tax=Trichonephila inaurata madagascariensis TaxID=2747483 RepID=A0A8X6X2W3_9ARAC|nr:hypothetical protein TNIN_299111 [Trichonephila inaurata madagascariensis]
MNCRGQAYDNATAMAGCHTGVQQRIKGINPNAEFVPCSNHSLNLVCVHATSVEDIDEVKFITLSRIRFSGHICHLDTTSPTHKIFKHKLMGSRIRGRPRLQWLDSINIDFKS